MGLSIRKGKSQGKGKRKGKRKAKRRGKEKELEKRVIWPNFVKDFSVDDQWPAGLRFQGVDIAAQLILLIGHNFLQHLYSSS